MGLEVKIDRGGAPIRAGVRILVPHIGVSALDIWLDADGNGRPDKFHRRAKRFNRHEGQLVEVDTASALLGNVLQWTWMASKTPDAPDEVKVELLLVQGNTRLQTTDGQKFPLGEANTIRPNRQYDIFESWVRFV